MLVEKPGANRPEDFFELHEKLKAYPDIIVEYGWEMHYAEVIVWIRGIVSGGVLGQVTTSRWHGGTPSGGGLALWQRQEGTLGGVMYMDGSHTVEGIISVFGVPRSVCASVRKLSEGDKHLIVNCWYGMREGQLDPAEVSVAVGTVGYEDIGSVILECETHNVVADFTAWQPTDWREDWGTHMYGTNGALHGVLNPPQCHVQLREGRGRFPAGRTEMRTELAPGVNNQPAYFRRQLESLLRRVEDCSRVEIVGLQTQSKLMKVLQAFYKSAEDRRFVDIT
jgi:predicted dehydrogenase